MTLPNCSGRDPGPGFVLLVEVVDFYLARGHPSEQAHRLLHSVGVTDDDRALPGRVLEEAQLDPYPSVLEPGPRLQLLEVGEHEQHPHLAGLNCIAQGWDQDVSIVLEGEPPRSPEADRPGWHVSDLLDHYSSLVGATSLAPASSTAGDTAGRSRAHCCNEPNAVSDHDSDQSLLREGSLGARLGRHPLPRAGTPAGDPLDSSQPCRGQ